MAIDNDNLSNSESDTLDNQISLEDIQKDINNLNKNIGGSTDKTIFDLLQQLNDKDYTIEYSSDSEIDYSEQFASVIQEQQRQTEILTNISYGVIVLTLGLGIACGVILSKILARYIVS